MTTQAAPPAATSRLRALLPTLLDLVIPTAGYFLLHWAGLPDVWALTIAGSATGVNAIVNSVRRRRLRPREARSGSAPRQSAGPPRP